jgi:UDP-N-acetylmuramoyl-tripeptide--D-alanyl-D-alanine ligase
MSNATFNWPLSQIARVMDGELIGDDAVVRGVSTDSRSIARGQLFIALVGPNFNGHDFIAHAEQRGAVGVVVSEETKTSLNRIVVNDTKLALGQLANAWRGQFDIPLIAVTGSNGKTTVKEMMASILGTTKTTLATQGNLNNDIGMPLTLLRLTNVHQAAVIEMGANHPGEIDYLSKLAKPNVAVITNAGPAHLEGFGSIEGVARAKGEIYAGLDSAGTAIINADDHYADYWRSLCQHLKVMTFGLSADADVSAKYQTSITHTELDMATPAGHIQVRLPLLGIHNVMNALAATAACLAAGVANLAIKQGLEKLQNVAGRLQLKKGKAGSRIIDDTYNANPASLRAALEVLHDLPGRHYLAIGDMGELGSDAEQLHRDAGKQARDTGVSRVYAIGKYAKYIAQSFGKDGQEYLDHLTMASAINDSLSSDVTLLVKGSRLMQMEKVVNALLANGENR